MTSIVQQLQSYRNYALIDCKNIPPFQALARISKLFESNPELVDRVNALTPEGKCMNVKTAALNQTTNKKVDLKIPFDMSPERLDALGKELRAELGDDFDTVILEIFWPTGKRSQNSRLNKNKTFLLIL